MVKHIDPVKLSKNGESIILNDKRMEIGKNYSLTYKGSKYVARKTSEGKVEIYAERIF